MTETYTYDGNGNLATIKIGGQRVWERDSYTGTQRRWALGPQPLYVTRKYSNKGLLTEQEIIRQAGSLLKMTYTYNTASGNLTQRTGMNGTENFTYDNFDRLTTGTSYALNGNIGNKTSIGRYTYDATKKHAVVQVENSGNLIPKENVEITYNAFNKVETVTKGSAKLSITYGPNRQRTKTELIYNSTTTTTLYADNYEQRTKNGTTTTYHYVASPDGLVAVYIKPKNATKGEMYYIETDHLGSIVRIYDFYGDTKFSASYDAWGNQTISTNAIGISRGFPIAIGSGHEHWNQFGLIDMNGRFYDPLLGRFLSPDPYVQMPENPQNFNRYSYCLNNPLKYTDPSGEYFWILPNIGYSKEGGFNFGVSAVLGIPGEYSVQLGLNYSCGSNDFSVFLGATANFNTVYAGFSTQSGFNAGYTAGLSLYSGFPINTNFTTVGLNYNISNDNFSGNMSAWQYDQYGNFSFNPSVSAVIFPERTTNLVRGQGFRNNDAVLQRFVDAGQQQAALDYFGFKGKYDPNRHKSSNYDADDFYGCTNSRTGDIYFGNLAFDNYATLIGTYTKELYTSRNIRSGQGIAQLPTEFQGLGCDTFLEEINGYIYAYRNQGLYRNCSEYLYTGIKYYQSSLRMLGMSNIPTYPQRFSFIYKIPRLW